MFYTGKEELWDVYTEKREPTGTVVFRGKTILLPDQYHLCVEGIIFNKKHEILVTQRASTKQRGANLWEVTAGSVKSGEDTKQAVIREILEETGLDVSKCKIRMISTSKSHSAFRDSFAIYVPALNIADVKLQKDETMDAKIVSKDELYTMIASDEFYTAQGRRLMSLVALGEEKLFGKIHKPLTKSKGSDPGVSKVTGAPTKRRAVVGQ